MAITSIMGKPASARPRNSLVRRDRKDHKDRRTHRVHGARSRAETPPPVCSRAGDSESYSDPAAPRGGSHARARSQRHPLTPPTAPEREAARPLPPTSTQQPPRRTPANQVSSLRFSRRAPGGERHRGKHSIGRRRRTYAFPNG